jgi:hypothetical protein
VVLRVKDTAKPVTLKAQATDLKASTIRL